VCVVSISKHAATDRTRACIVGPLYDAVIVKDVATR
jgi:hypothetical protein